MSTKQWYKVLLEENLTTEIKEETGMREPSLSRVERKSPEVDWGRTWGYLNTKGLGGEKMSFLLRMLYDILPVNSRLFRMNLSQSPLCDLCTCGTVQDLPHALLECQFNSFVNDWIVAVLINIDPGLIDAELTATKISTLNFPIDHESKFPILWFLAVSLSLIWEGRKIRKPMSVEKLQALIGAEVEILKQTKYRKSADKIDIATNFSIV